MNKKIFPFFFALVLFSAVYAVLLLIPYTNLKFNFGDVQTLVFFMVIFTIKCKFSYFDLLDEIKGFDVNKYITFLTFLFVILYLSPLEHKFPNSLIIISILPIIYAWRR